MSITEELEKLRDLYDDGVLTAGEFTEAKRQLLHPSPAVAPAPSDHSTLAQSAERYVSFQMMMSIVGLVIFLLFFFLFWLPGFERASGNAQPHIQIQLPPHP